MAKHRRARRTRRRSRGWLVRGTGIFFGFLLGSAVIAGTLYPLSRATARIRLDPQAIVVPDAAVQRFAWPTSGSGAVAVPDLGISALSRTQTVSPIASLTKLMTAYVVLRQLPLAVGQSGPCLTVTADDVAEYEYEQRADQSSVKVVEGTELCEIDLLNGLFVHSANNYAELLVKMVGMDDETFVATMNANARRLRMQQTSYADVSGINNNSVSTAGDQLRIVTLLMASDLIRQIVRQTSVDLPGAGTVRTFTPMLGTKGVVGIKSGRTDAAGGCDAMALETTRNGTTFLTYAVVLGQRGPSLLKAAGDAAFALATSAADQVIVHRWLRGTSVGRLGWPGATTSVIVSKTTTSVWWRTAPHLSVKIVPRGGQFRARSTVGELVASSCTQCQEVPVVRLIARHGVIRPIWWHGIA